VEAQQCVQLTRTNRPFGLTINLPNTFSLYGDFARGETLSHRATLKQNLAVYASSFSCSSKLADYDRASFDFQFPGGLTARVTPVPIPNTEVKPRRADDTALETARERRSPPGLSSKAVPACRNGLFCLHFTHGAGWPGRFRLPLNTALRNAPLQDGAAFRLRFSASNATN
jgi:hypothetical protein